MHLAFGRKQSGVECIILLNMPDPNLEIVTFLVEIFVAP